MAVGALSIAVLPFSSVLAAASIPKCGRDLLIQFPSSQAGKASWDGLEIDGYPG